MQPSALCLSCRFVDRSKTLVQTLLLSGEVDSKAWLPWLADGGQVVCRCRGAPPADTQTGTQTDRTRYRSVVFYDVVPEPRTAVELVPTRVTQRVCRAFFEGQACMMALIGKAVTSASSSPFNINILPGLPGSDLHGRICCKCDGIHTCTTSTTTILERVLVMSMRPRQTQPISRVALV